MCECVCVVIGKAETATNLGRAYFAHIIQIHELKIVRGESSLAISLYMF